MDVVFDYHQPAPSLESSPIFFSEFRVTSTSHAGRGPGGSRSTSAAQPERRDLRTQNSRKGLGSRKEYNFRTTLKRKIQHSFLLIDFKVSELLVFFSLRVEGDSFRY